MHISDQTFPLLNQRPQDNLIENNPFELFQLFFTDELFQHFVDSSNRFINENIEQKSSFLDCKIQPRYDVKQKNITLNEMKLYIGIILFFGICSKSYLGILINQLNI